jgi:hypothetical protein
MFLQVESTMVPLRQELNRTKDALNKERMGRQQIQQELMMLREQCSRLEQQRESLERDTKTIPALTESNEILKSDLSQLRKRFKDEKIAMQKHIKQLEGQAREAEQIKAEVRQMAVRMMELSAGGSTTVVPTGGGMASNLPPPQNTSSMMMQQNAPNTMMSYASANANPYANPNHQSLSSFSSQYQYDFDEEDDDDEMNNHDSDYDTNGYIDDLATPMVGSSMESLGMMNNNSMNTARGGGGGNGGGAGNASTKKKKIKKRVVQSNTTGSNAMNASPSHMINRSNTMHVMQPLPTGRNNADSFNLPRIH